MSGAPSRFATEEQMVEIEKTLDWYMHCGGSFTEEEKPERLRKLVVDEILSVLKIVPMPREGV